MRRCLRADLAGDAAVRLRTPVPVEGEDGSAAQDAAVQIQVGGDQLVAWAMISPWGFTMTLWPNSSHPSSVPALAEAIAKVAFW